MSMKVYIKISSEYKNFDKILTKFLEKANKIHCSKVDTYPLKVDNNQIIIKFTNHIKLLRTIKFIDDLIDLELRTLDKDSFFSIVVSSSFIDKEYSHRGVLFLLSEEDWEKIKHSSLIKDYKITNDGVIFKFLFYSKIEYSEIVVLQTKNKNYEIMIAKVPSNNKEFTIIGNIRNLNLDSKVAVRIHYQCETSEIFGSNHCDCKEQLDTFLEIMQNNKNSILIYCHEEGRGLGLFNKINAYYLTATEKLDTNDAMLKVAGKTENRMFEIPADILFYLGIKSVELWTNNPLKIEPIEARWIKVFRKKIWSDNLPDTANKYVLEKKLRMGHIDD